MSNEQIVWICNLHVQLTKIYFFNRNYLYINIEQINEMNSSSITNCWIDILFWLHLIYLFVVLYMQVIQRLDDSYMLFFFYKKKVVRIWNKILQNRLIIGLIRFFINPNHERCWKKFLYNIEIKRYNITREVS